MRDVVVMAEAVRAAISSFLMMMPIALEIPGARAKDSTAPTGIRSQSREQARAARGFGAHLLSPPRLAAIAAAAITIAITTTLHRHRAIAVSCSQGRPGALSGHGSSGWRRTAARAAAVAREAAKLAAEGGAELI